MNREPLLAKLSSWLLFSAGSTLLIPGVRATYLGNAPLAATALAAALIFLLAATVERFETLKGLGIEAKTRQLDQKLDEAEETLKRLREVAELSGAALISLNSQIGRWNAAPSPEDSYRLAQQVGRILEALGCSKSVIHKTLHPWIKSFTFDLARSVARPIRNALSERQNELRQKQMAVGSGLPSEEQERLTRELNAINEYQEQLFSRLPNMALSEDSSAMLRLIDEAPVDNESLKREVGARWQLYANDISVLLREFRLSDPRPWFQEINEDRSS